MSLVTAPAWLRATDEYPFLARWKLTPILKFGKLLFALPDPAMRERLAELAAFMRQGGFSASSLMEVIP